METRYEEYYENNLKAANEYQDFVCIHLIKKGIVLSNMSSQKFQNELGENLQGFEIKFDRLFRQTNNLYIEVAEKSNPSNMNYVKSGIFRNDNSWIYAIGDYEGIYLIQKKVLKSMYEKNRFKEVKKPTSIGMLLPLYEADKYFDYIEFENIQP